jgi:hypothetical protein
MTNETITAVATKSTYLGSCVAVLAGFTSAEIVQWAGLGLGVIGLIVNWVYKHKEYKAKLTELEAKYGKSN